MEVDLNLLLEKERNKIIKQRARNAKKAIKKAKKEAQKVKDKAKREAKKGKRAGKSKVVVAASPPILLTETSSKSPSQNLCKQDDSFVQF